MGHATRLAQDAALTDSYLMTGNSLSLVANRISHVLDLRGPSSTIDTACSSSIFALKQAEDALRLGEIDIAIVAAVNAILDPIHFVGFSAARMLSPTGRCKPFSADADGYVRAEGAAAFVLESGSLRSIRPRRAYCEVVAVGTNTAGRTLNVALPSVEGQASLLRQLYRKAGVDPDDLAFVEAHGTGTLAGDPVEATALGQVLGRARKSPLVIGSIKSNIGHLEPASGIAGLMKAIIALDRRCYPATLHASEVNPNIDFQGLNLSVAQDHVSFADSAGPLLAGVSSFGFGGANAHAILREVRDQDEAPASAASRSGEPLLLLSAFAADALGKSMKSYAALIAKDARTGAAPIADLASQVTRARGIYPHRAAVICDSAEEAVTALSKASEGESDPRVILAQSDLTDAPAAFVFSGNGSQYAGMGLAALATDPAYARGLKKIDRAFRKLSGWSIIARMRSPDLETELGDCAVAQPLLFADQMALSWSLAERGFVPAAVMGHSGGEVAAACASGALSLDQALRLVHSRSLALQSLRGRGRMAAIQAAADEVEAEIAGFGGGVEVAAVNSPKSVTIVGSSDRIDAFMRHARRVNRWPAVLLAIEYPFHSSAVDEVATALDADLDTFVPGPARVPFVSSVTGQSAKGTDLDATYWRTNMRRPVAFLSAMQTLQDMGLRAFIEIGPSPVLGNYMAACLDSDTKPAILSSFEKPGHGGINPVQRCLARALAHGLRIDRRRLFAAPRRIRRDLPHYPWADADLRIDRTPAVLNRYGDVGAGDVGAGLLLGREDGVGTGTWYSEIDQHVLPAFCDHRVGGKVIVPSTALAEMALGAACATLGTDHIELRDVDLLAPVVLGRTTMTEVRTRASAEQATVRIGTRPRGTEAPLRPHLQARFFPAMTDSPAEPAPDATILPGDEGTDRLYRAARQIGLDYGPRFALCNRTRTLQDGAVEVFLDPAEREDTEQGPTLIDIIGTDAAFHGLIAAMEGSENAADRMGYVPVRIGRLTLLKPKGRVASARIRVMRSGKRTVVARFTLYDAAGQGLSVLEGVRFQAVRLHRDISLEHHSFRQILLPLDPADAITASLDPGVVASIASEPSFDPDDEAFFMLEAAAQAVAAEALRAVADATGKLPPELTWPTPYAAGLLAICARAEAVERLPVGWRMIERPNAIDPEKLLSLIARTHPTHGTERAMLEHLRAVLPRLLSGADELPTPTSLFGRDGLASLTEGSVFSARSAAVLSKAVLRFARDWPRGRILRIAEVTDGAARCLPRLLRDLPADVATFHEILVAPVDEPAAPVSLPIDRVTQVDGTAEGLARSGPFDVILVHGLLFRMPSPAALLRSLGATLSDVGMIALVEPAPSDFADLVFGTSPGWFSDVASPNGPTARHLDHTGLASISGQAGLANVQIASLPEGCGTASILVARAVAVPKDRVDPDLALAGDLQDVLAMASRSDRPFHRVDSNETALVLFPPAPDAADPVTALSDRFLALVDLVADISASRKRLVAIIPSGSGQNGPVRRGQTALWSLMRTVANENPALPMACYDVHPDLAPGRAAHDIATLEALSSPETEVVLRPGAALALRVLHGTGSAAPARTLDMRSFLEAPITGGLDDLHWKAVPRSEPSEGEVEIAIATTGLNYRDVMWSMGLLPEEAVEQGFAGPTIGIECAGTVTRVGPGVTGLVAGDRVLTFGPALFASHQIVRADLAALLPSDTSFEAATTLPVAFFTAWYALDVLAGLRSDEWVLIHGGAGGVGLAAIQIAKRKGAKIIATAGSAMKRALLRAEGVAHVLDSRSLVFAEEIRALTGERGVDVVLNSLAGEAMERSMTCLAPFGRFLELGKQDFYANTGIGLRVLKENISYHGVDVDQLLAHHPALATGILGQIMTAFHAGELQPLPYRVFDGTDARSAFRLMQKSGHIGKILIRPAEAGEVSAAPRPFRADPDGFHLVVGGMGGLGLKVADWLIDDAGARHVVLISRRSELSDEVRDNLGRWSDKGAQVRLVSCDVADAGALQAALATLRTERPISGVIHSAMVLDDMPMSRVDGAVLARTLPSKVAGGENLDQLTRGDKLDYFVLFTSLATLIGNHGQSAYVAANGYLEGIARDRRTLGLPAVAIGWG
ncbi:MAG: acyltransferase domain-containing protein, partial [Rhodobacterales bacterium]|nr:acyltransferase domain-containing protein [Rhodobacterales bacterium]